VNRIAQKILFTLRFHVFSKIMGALRKIWYMGWGMQIGKNTFLPKIYVTWPHQVQIGITCIIEENVRFKFDGVWQPGPAISISDRVFIGSGCEFNISHGLVIGSDSLIGSGCRFIDHNHGTELSSLMRTQICPANPIFIRQNVWLGCNVIVLKGVTIGSGAIVAAGAVVTKSIPEDEIWAGVPARKIGIRK
jgi:acetyltransferase-like isoleucine patch superfamily enzyme